MKIKMCRACFEDCDLKEENWEEISEEECIYKDRLQREYTNEKFKTDIEWLEGLGVSRFDAKRFILYLLNKKPSREFKNA